MGRACLTKSRASIEHEVSRYLLSHLCPVSSTLDRMIPLRPAILALAAVLLLVACGGDDTQPSTPPIAEVTAAPPPGATSTPAVGGTFIAGPTARLGELQGLVCEREVAGPLAY